MRYINQRKIIILSSFLSIVFLISTNTSLPATQQLTSPIISPVSFEAYPEYYQKIASNKEINLVYPRSSIPMILTPEQSGIIHFQSIDMDDISASITTAYDPLPDNILLVVESITEDQNIKYATITIPKDTPQGLYNFTLTIENGEGSYSTTRPRAISIKDEISDSFTFIHLTDFHIGDPRGLIHNPREIIGWRAARKTIEEINLLNPDFVIITGDLTFGQLYPFEYTIQYNKCYEILQEFTVPTFLCPGNHDGYIQTFQDGLRFWEAFFGPAYYSFDYHNTHILSINSYDWPARSRLGFSYLVFNWGGSIREDQLNWIETDLDQNYDADQTFIMMHHNPLWDTTSDSLLGNGYYNREALLHLIRTNNVDAVFAGHVHYDDVTIDNQTMFITTTTVTSSISKDGYWGYRLINVENSTITEYNYQEPKYSIPSYHINILDEQTNSITIENKLFKPITVQHQFIVPLDEYTLNSGEIIQIREKDDMAAVLVSATIDEESTETIMLS
jgi:3',5'-cyclic AMP phosphodiesterase CpdA